jgi:hypothetical protein
VWWDVFRHGGIRYGEDHTHFSNRENVEYNVSRKDTKFRKFMFVVTSPGRAFLTASDNAFKAVLHKKIFMMAIHKALRQNGMTKEEANNFLNEALYGKNFEAAKAQAEKILQLYNLKATPQTIVRLANDLVVANLNTGGVVSMELIKAAKKSSFNVAAIGLGHRAQDKNFLAKRIENHKQAVAKEEQELANKKDWNALARARATNMVWNDLIFPFMSGITNWIYLKVQSGFGVGIASGLMGKWKTDIDFSSEKAIEESIFNMRNDSQKIARGIIGLSYASVFYATVAALAGGGDDEEEKSAMEKAFAAVKGDYVLNKFFKKGAPDIMLMHYMMSTNWYHKKNPNDPSIGNTLGALEYVQNLFNLGSSYTMEGQIMAAGQDLGKGKSEAAAGDLGNALGSRVDFPLWRAYKGYWQVIQWGAGQDVESDYKKPLTFTDGLFAGGFLEDMGIWNREVPIGAVPGVGDATLQQLQKQGINTFEQLKGMKLDEIRNEKGHRIFGKNEIERFNKFVEQESK